jgi:2,4-dienoyl-CoA reductase-like NADH-dependent reductase (Old Yellow Enzyme family)
MFTPFRLRGLTLRNRVVVSPMDMYSATDGLPGDFHLVHLGARALGGAGLVMTEMVCVSAEGRITPGCTGLYTGKQAEAWRRITDFVHARAPGTAIGVQLGHSGRKGSTRLMWEGMDEPLEDGNWPLVAASPIPYKANSQPGGPPGPASTCWSCTARTATCSPVSSPRSPTTARTPTAARSRDACASRWRSSTPCEARGPRRSP